MSDVFQTGLKIMGFIFAALLLGFTGYQTWNLLNDVTLNPFIATLGLVIFEGGMLYWWFYFQKSAEGLYQMALSILMFLIGLVLVSGATGLHLGAVDAQTFGPDTPAKLITAAAIVNVTAKLLMPLLHPDTMLSSQQKAAQGKIMARAFKLLDAKVDDIAEELAEAISGDMLIELEQAALATRRRPRLIEGKANYVNGRTKEKTPLAAFEPIHQSEEDEDPKTAEPNTKEPTFWISADGYHFRRYGQPTDETEFEIPKADVRPAESHMQPDPLPASPNGRIAAE